MPTSRGCDELDMLHNDWLFPQSLQQVLHLFAPEILDQFDRYVHTKSLWFMSFPLSSHILNIAHHQASSGLSLAQVSSCEQKASSSPSEGPVETFDFAGQICFPDCCSFFQCSIKASRILCWKKIGPCHGGQHLSSMGISRDRTFSFSGCKWPDVNTLASMFL